LIDLLDASVWLPLAAADHVHHARARRYWENESADRIAFCRITALALLRHLTNRAIMRHAVLTSGEAWEEYQRWLALPETVFLSEPATLEQRLGRLSRSNDLRPKLWTDAYLAAFAIEGDCRLVAFDSGFERFREARVLRLDSSEDSSQ
jgi:toxin-antitoxin system PIN domain toxin